MAVTELSGWRARLLPAALLVCISTLAFAPTAQAVSLDSILSKHANLTKYYGMTKDFPDLFAQLPTSKLTIVAPSDSAFQRQQNFNVKDRESVKKLFQFHALKDEVLMSSLKPGESLVASTLLTDVQYSNVTGGQKVILTKQPAGNVVFTSGVASRGTVIDADVAFDGGLVQVIDSIMVAPARLEATARDSYTDLTSFLGALYASGLLLEFAETPDMTILAPRNTAFQQLAGTLGKMDPDKLRRVLHYHLVPGKWINNEALLNGTELQTAVDGKKVTITRFNNNIYINSAQIIQTDILLANGIVQMIDNVLNPDDDDADPDVTLGTQTPVFPLEGATATGSAEPTPFASALPCTKGCTSAVTGTGGPGARSTSSSNGVPPAKCTGMVVGAGVGLAAAVGVLGAEMMGAL